MGSAGAAGSTLDFCHFGRCAISCRASSSIGPSQPFSGTAGAAAVSSRHVQQAKHLRHFLQWALVTWPQACLVYTSALTLRFLAELFTLSPLSLQTYWRAPLPSPPPAGRSLMLSLLGWLLVPWRTTKGIEVSALGALIAVIHFPKIVFAPVPTGRLSTWPLIYIHLLTSWAGSSFAHRCC